jgi:hypothetical protein
VQQRAIVTIGLESGVAERGLYDSIARDNGGLVTPVPYDSSSAALARKRQ